MENTANILFPHQLFKDSPLLGFPGPCYLVEEHLFFRQYMFHKRKLAFHRSSMRKYAGFLRNKGINVEYIESHEKRCDIRVLIKSLAEPGIRNLRYIDPTDDWLQKRLVSSSAECGIGVHKFPTRLFWDPEIERNGFFRKEKKKFHHATFYRQQRKRAGVLLGPDLEPVGGKWSFDTENRKKYPAGKVPPKLFFPEADEYWHEAVDYVEKHYQENPGAITQDPIYPNDFDSAQSWLRQFLRERFAEFGPFEDAIVREEFALGHSVLSPLINVGLITVDDVLNQALEFSEANDIPINSTEGFVRQLIGWREFIRGVYETKGREERTTNFWGFSRKIPASFWDGTTGIDPIDTTIKKVLKTGYCHHIERLMILGNFMLLCEFDPDEVYRWFMEMFIDAYDWVMVPNVYGMSQFADGGLMSTKPYISGSNYVLKMSNYSRGEWQVAWDGLFWRFMDKQRKFFNRNPRMRMLLSTLDRMDNKTRSAHFENAEAFLRKLD
ncbi:MAG: cryptochrome/photolyase family protein [Acidobacteriota bacterium]|nr:cryptochrome/photolyase family protein [Acidobacteriota bacterium]MDH3530755.1 cryptochrome/photolyase family protein [Acidobacteriota bacterium]